MSLFTTVSPVLSVDANGTFVLAIGPVSYNILRGDAGPMIRAEKRDLGFIVAQIALGLDAAGFTLAGKTDAQIIAAVNSLTIKI